MKSKRFGIIAVSAVAGALLLTACNEDDVATGASGAASSPAASDHSSAGTGHSGGSTVRAGQWGKNKEDARFFWSDLNGANEVPVEGGPAVGDKDGRSLALMRIQGDQVSYAFTFKGTETPTLGHLHKGVKGVNGDVKIPFFTEKLEDGKKFTYGTVTVDDRELLEGIKANPQNWYFNIHTGEFPGGAVRGQASSLPSSISVPDAMSEGTLNSVMSGVK
ncbi:CHRD domain-containing protein [Streptomyces sp. IB201691-2A2]|uniref:CHRD domain-containing protein n=1 Tax=Streptomyces sp. IB201691-2A2 TaxID=2561920 RepID=UPI00117C9197|nr:CHRD domain-containing protein [Streptomyces sp. IB201691-2A2]TRO56093.1 CHRD domain-containing protein [Streptomyces sp. IB201691-2A2]